LLKDKPAQMLQVSSKGTVPVLQFPNKVLDESLDIISWAMESPAPNVHAYTAAEELLTQELIQLFDSKFKYHLDQLQILIKVWSRPT
jgi:glutathione S-transferase